MMHFARFASFDHKTHGRAQALADQVMMHGGGGQQSGYRNAVRPDHTVGQDDDVVAAAHGVFGALAQATSSISSRASAPRSDA